MDREFHEPPVEKPRVEKPVLAINELGVTVPEKDPVTGGNIIQNIDANIRMGASKLQIVMSTPHTQAIGGRPKAYGKEARESIRELARANEVMIEGVELPTSSMSNLSGFDPQRGNISEEKRQRDLQEVKEAISFVADIAGGGGVDIWSQEFQRNIVDADWNKKGKWAGKFEAYETEEKFATEYLVDQRTGQIMSEIRHSSDIHEPMFKTAEEDYWGYERDGKTRRLIKKGEWIDMDDRWIDPKDPEQLLHRYPEWDDVNKKFKSQRLEWKDIVKRTHTHNERYGTDWDPAEYAFQIQLQNKWIQTRGSSLFYTRQYEDQIKRRKAYQQALEHYEKLEKEIPEEELWRIMREDPVFRGEFLPTEFKKPTELLKDVLGSIDHDLKHVHEASAAADANAEEIQRTMDQVVSLKKYAKEKAFDSYAEAGIVAMNETQLNPNAERAIHVGPEIGWPAGWGGHPEEFIELIQNSRKRMADRLVQEKGYSEDKAKQLAKKHISGCFDTGHMGMWLDHFKKDHPHETEESRRKRFNNWYMDMVAKMQDAEVIGSVQAVDSATGAHGHLPPGEGIFPVVEAVDYLKSKGFQGFVVSEGHEEEQFGKGRILLQTWKAFGAEIADSYFAATPTTRWSDVADTYFGHVNPPPYIIGQYRPSDDWTFWSGVPLE
jgi:sugar phosphate isomerase/epimerase